MISVAEREAKARIGFLAAFEKLCPYVANNPYIPHWPFPQQAIFLGLHQNYRQKGVFQALYGGAAGGGKSDCLLMGAAQYAWKHPEFSAILFRRTHTDLAQAGALMDRAFKWWIPTGVHWDGTNKIFRFPNGARVAMAYLKNPNDHHRYRSAEYQYVGFDELTEWKDPRQYEFIGLSRTRKPKGSHVPLRCLNASNPGGPGHSWVQKKFVDDGSPYPYVPASIKDNIHIEQEDYIANLMQLHPTVREQLLNGDWSARDKGDYFRQEWYGPLLDPETDTWPQEDCIRIRWWDPAASTKEHAARTAGVLQAKHRMGVIAVEHCRSFKANPGLRDDWILQQAKLDGYHTTVGFEIEPGSGGIAQFEAIEKRLRKAGYRVVGSRPRAPLHTVEGRLHKHPATSKGKEGRADPVAACLQRGYIRRGECPRSECGSLSLQWGLDEGRSTIHQRDGIRLFAGDWTQKYLDSIEGFPPEFASEGSFDEVDATSGGFDWLKTQNIGMRFPIEVQKELVVDSYDIHPEDRTVDYSKGGDSWVPRRTSGRFLTP